MDNTLLFLHIPKSAGTTLNTNLSSQYYNMNYKIHELDQEKMRRFYEGDIFYFPIGFYKDPQNILPDYILQVLGMPDLKVVSGHFSYGIHGHINNNCKYITILRDPIERVVSLYYHLVNTNIIKEEVSLEEFLEEIPEDGWTADLTEWYPLKPDFQEPEIRKPTQSIIDNDQTRRISGLEPPFGKCGELEYNTACRHIEKDFLLVGLTERFDETMLLLKHKLGWQKTIHYIPKLINRKKPKINELPAHVIDKIKQLNFWDNKLYEFAKQLFEKEVKSCGEDFMKETNEYKKENAKYIESVPEAKEWDLR
jgi:hypothetical protein